MNSLKICDEVLVCERIKKIGALLFVTPKNSFLGLSLTVLEGRRQRTLMATKNLRKEENEASGSNRKSKELFISNSIYCFPTVCQAEHI